MTQVHLAYKERDHQSYIPEGLLDKNWRLPLQGSGAIDLEIGCGNGAHPLLYGASQPERSLIAIEHTRNKFERFLASYQKAGEPKNIYPIHANAISFVPGVLADYRFDRVFLLYPNPSPKHRQRNKRWHYMPFMGELVQRLADDGELHLRTNLAWYFEEAVKAMDAIWGLGSVRVTEMSPKSVAGLQAVTQFERKYLQQGQTCFHGVFSRESNKPFSKATAQSGHT